jgi:hypothetical protein
VVDLTNNSRRALTRESDFRSPIFLLGDQKVIALKGEDVVQIDLTRIEMQKLFTAKGVTKLVGPNLDDPNKVLVLSDSQNQPSVELLSLSSGEMARITYDPALREDRRTIVHLQGWERVYGDAKVYVKSETKSGVAGPIEWTDVYLKRGGAEPVNVSNCDGSNCGQPALSQNKKFIIYIKAAP